MDLTKYEKIFTQESERYLLELDDALLRVEAAIEDRDLWGQIHGKIHSIKGMARALSLESISNLCHRMEEWCKRFQEGAARPSADAVQQLLDGEELLKLLVARKGEMDTPETTEAYNRLKTIFQQDPATVYSPRGDSESPGTAAPDGDASPPVPPRIDQVRVKYALIEELLGYSQETLLLEKTLPPISRESAGVRSWIDHYMSMLKGLYFRLAQLRLMSVQDFAGLFTRVIRDMARQYGKDVRLDLVGGELEADIALLDRLREPLVHILRNAIAHGLESGPEREEQGKPAQGRIVLEAVTQREALVINVSDDGRGIHRAALRRYLQEQCRMSEAEIDALSDPELFNTILRVDFSSAPETTDLAGRGIGMSVVAQAIDYLGGSLTIESEEGRGTTFTIQLPVSLSVIYAITFKVGGFTLSIPTSSVASIDRLSEDRLSEPRGAGPGGLCEVGDLLGLGPDGYTRTHVLRLGQSGTGRDMDTQAPPAVLGKGPLELEVGEIVGNKPVMVMPTGELLSRIGLFAGVGILENGDVSMLLDVDKLRGITPAGTTDRANSPQPV